MKNNDSPGVALSGAWTGDAPATTWDVNDGSVMDNEGGGGWIDKAGKPPEVFPLPSISFVGLEYSCIMRCESLQTHILKECTQTSICYAVKL